MGTIIYRMCVALKELGERSRLDPLVWAGKVLTVFVSRRVSAGGGKG